MGIQSRSERGVWGNHFSGPFLSFCKRKSLHRSTTDQTESREDMDVSTKGTELNQRLRGESGSCSSNGHPVLECLVQSREILADDAIIRSGEDGRYSLQLRPRFRRDTALRDRCRSQ